MDPKPLIRVRVFFGCVALLVTLPACNTDRVWRDSKAPEGPVDEHVPAARLAASREGVDIALTDAREVDLAEEVVAHRRAYHQGLTRLRDFYAQRGYATKQRWADFELEGLRSVKPFRYVVDAEIPIESLRGTDSIAQADVLYERGLELMRRGGHGTPALYREELMVQAANVFRDLISQYPSSDKIDDAAFQLGEIHKEYLRGQDTLAVKWYERSWTWNPATPHPARFQAAVVYDYRLHDRDRALELYQAVVKQETQVGSNVRFASRRIHELSQNPQTARAAAR
jgi:hypothetical protein